MNYLLLGIGAGLIYLYLNQRKLTGELKRMSEQETQMQDAITELQASVAAEKTEVAARVATLETKITGLEERLAGIENAPDLSEEIAAIRQAAADVRAIVETPPGPPDEEVAPPTFTDGQ